MGSNSSDFEDVAKWIESVIDSCETPIQLSVAKNLTKLFLNQVKKVSPDLVNHYSLHLNKRLHDKFQ